MIKYNSFETIQYTAAYYECSNCHISVLYGLRPIIFGADPPGPASCASYRIGTNTVVLWIIILLIRNFDVQILQKIFRAYNIIQNSFDSDADRHLPPLLYAGKWHVPCADDHSFGCRVHDTVMNNVSLRSILSETGTE